MIAILKPLLLRAATLFGVLLVVLLLLVVSLGATGYSDRLLEAQINEELRSFRIASAQTIRDPADLEQAVGERRIELTEFYGLDEPWWRRMPRANSRCHDPEPGSGAIAAHRRRK